MWRFQFFDFIAETGLIVFHPNIPQRVETFRFRPLVELHEHVFMEIHEF